MDSKIIMPWEERPEFPARDGCVVDKTQLVRIDVEHSRLVLETQDVCEERAHFPGSKY